MDSDYFKRKITVEQAEAENLVTSERLGTKPVPFGFCNPEWKALLAQMQPGDELWEFSTSGHSWEHLAGRAGIALVRNGKDICSVTTKMN